MKTEEITKKLAAPFEVIGADGKKYGALNWLPQKGGNVKENGVHYQIYIPYITANQVAERLNEVLGIDGWNNVLIETSGQNGKFIISELSCRIDGKDVTRSDVGSPSNFDPEKGMASDALKRSARLFGVGAYISKMQGVKIRVEGGFIVTEKGQKIAKEDKNAINSYINTKNPLRAKLTEIYIAIPEAKRKDFDEMFKKIFDELS